MRENLGEPTSIRAWVQANGSRVVAGPLAGLSYPLELIERTDAALLKLQGDYESEIHRAIQNMIEALRNRPGGLFLDVGSSEGYYAAGVARVADCKTIAFDAAATARRATRTLASTNAVAVETRGVATESRLLKLAPRVAALLCDIEGGEVDTITARLAQALASAVVVVELHGKQAITEVPARFSDSHLVEVVPCTPKGLRLQATPWLVALPRRDVK